MDAEWSKQMTCIEDRDKIMLMCFRFLSLKINDACIPFHIYTITANETCVML